MKTIVLKCPCCDKSIFVNFTDDEAIYLTSVKPTQESEEELNELIKKNNIEFG